MRLRHLYFISFIEGGVVMVAEIAGARMLTPYFGASLYSWAATLSITLFALMTGYYFGGYITTRHRFDSIRWILWVFLCSGLMVMLMPSLSQVIMKKTITLSFFTGLIISELIFLFLPIFLMGMISPMIICHITRKAEQSGRSAGNIYAVSTSGGILFTLVFGFLVVPNHGITMPLRWLGLIVSLIAAFFLLRHRLVLRMKLLPFLLIAATAMLSFKTVKFHFPERSRITMVEHSEGLLGELQVIDQVNFMSDGRSVKVRKLKTNNIQQNYVLADLPTQSLMYYVNFTKQLLKFLPRKESALLVGLGAGSLYAILGDMGMKVESVEIDERIYRMGIRYFGLAPHNNHITDGRYFLNVTPAKYDVVVLDVIIGESVPGQLITLENFKRCYDIINQDGALIIEHGGVLNFSDNSFIPSVSKTLEQAGFYVTIFNPLRSKKFGDILFVATKTKMETGTLSVTDDVLIKGGPLASYVLPPTTFDLANASVLTDDINNADILLMDHYFGIRKGIRKELATLAKGM